MNLTHLFNKDYLIQNLKKSKAMIIFISLLLPVFTLLLLNIVNQLDENIINFWELGFFNILFMYIVPVVLSIELFNYVFKKKSCDFVGSMPLSRKTIFTTNTIGGIAIIALIQIITAILCAIFSRLNTNIIIFGSMIWDLFVFFTVAYIFVFIVTNLAVSFSGNMFATIVSTMIILFFVPFTLMCSKIKTFDNYFYKSYNVDVYNTTFEYYKPLNFTAPSLLFDVATSNNTFEFKLDSVMKMIVISVIFFMLGIYLFDKKKYEMAEESYENNIIHIVMKCLSITPFIWILSASKLYESGVALAFFLAVLGVYFFLFDMITNKKMKLSISISTFFVSILVMFAFFEIIVPNLKFIYTKKVQFADINSLTIDTINASRGMYDNMLGLNITDNSVIVDILTDKEISPTFSSSLGNYSDSNVTITLKDNKGNKYSISKWIGKSMTKVLSQYGNQVLALSANSGVPNIDACTLTKDDRVALKKAINRDIENISFKEYYEKISKDKENYYLTLATYNNHKLNISDFSYGGFKQATSEAIKLCNREVNQNPLRPAYWNLTNQEIFVKYILKYNSNVKFDNLEETKRELEATEKMKLGEETISAYEDYKEEPITYEYERSVYGVISTGMNYIDTNVMAEFIKAHQNETFDKTKSYLSFMGNPTSIYYTNSIEDFYKLFAKKYNESEFSKEYNIVLNENI